jgi:hypothetical protein
MAASTIPINGDPYLLEVSTDSGSSWDAVAYQLDATISESTESREITSKTQTSYREYKATVSTWTLSGRAEFLGGTGSGLTLNSLRDSNRTEIEVRLHPYDTAGNEITGEFSYRGKGFFESINAAFPQKETATYDFTFKGSGTLTATAVS